MSTITSIVVTLDDGSTFNVDLANDCCLFWSDAGWNVLADYYDMKGDKTKAKEVRDKACPKAQSKDDQATATIGSPNTLIALKDDNCNPTQWP